MILAKTFSLQPEKGDSAYERKKQFGWIRHFSDIVMRLASLRKEQKSQIHIFENKVRRM